MESTPDGAPHRLTRHRADKDRTQSLGRVNSERRWWSEANPGCVWDFPVEISNGNAVSLEREVLGRVVFWFLVAVGALADLVSLYWLLWLL